MRALLKIQEVAENLRERLFAILREHGCDHIDNNLKLCVVRGSNIYKDVPCVERDFTVFRVDDRRERENAILFVIYDWVDGCITDDGEVLCEMLVALWSKVIKSTLIMLLLCHRNTS